MIPNTGLRKKKRPKLYLSLYIITSYNISHCSECCWNNMTKIVPATKKKKLNKTWRCTQTKQVQTIALVQYMDIVSHGTAASSPGFKTMNSTQKNLQPKSKKFFSKTNDNTLFLQNYFSVKPISWLCRTHWIVLRHMVRLKYHS